MTMSESGLFRLHNTKVIDIALENDTITMISGGIRGELVKVKFTTKHQSEIVPREILKLVGQKIKYVDVTDKGYEIYYGEGKEMVVLRANSFCIDHST